MGISFQFHNLIVLNFSVSSNHKHRLQPAKCLVFGTQVNEPANDLYET